MINFLSNYQIMIMIKLNLHINLKLLFADLSTLTVSPCVTWVHCLFHGLTVGSSFLTVLQIVSGFSLKLTIS